jgi:hypothetical protein
LRLKNDRLSFEQAYTQRSTQYLALDSDATVAKVHDWSSNVLIITTSPEYLEAIASLFDEIIYRANFQDLLPWLINERRADSVFEPITWERPSPRLGWEQGWNRLIRSRLTGFLELAMGEEA